MAQLQLNSTWTPPLSAGTLLNERSSLVGLFISAIAYGIIVPFAVMSMHLLYRSIDHTNRRMKVMWMAIVGFIFTCATIYVASLEVQKELAFSTYRGIPGGPSAFEKKFRGLPTNAVGLVFFIMATWVCDAVMVWRFIVLFRTCRYPLWAIVALPCAGLVTGVVLGTLWVIGVITSNKILNIPQPFYLTSIFLNVFISASLVGRLLWYRRKISKALGSQRINGIQYTELASMLIESAIPYMIFSLMAFLFVTLKSPMAMAVTTPFGFIQMASTMMIIFRVAVGSAWSSNTASDVMKQSSLASFKVATIGATPNMTAIGFSPYTSPVSEKPAIQPWTAMRNDDMV